MNREELVREVAGKVEGLTLAETKAAVNAVFETITEALAKKDSISLVGFGTFKTTTRAARTGRNPMTGASISIPEKTVPTFKASKAFKDLVNA